MVLQMIKKLLITVVCLIGATQSLYAEEVLYCTSEVAAALIKNESWTETKLDQKRFTIRLSDGLHKVEGLGEGEYNCNMKVSSKTLVCTNQSGIGQFIYLPRLQRFLFFKASEFGYLLNWGVADTDNLYAGTCKKF